VRRDTVVDLVGDSDAIEDLRTEIERVAHTDAKVLITGESGVGKELVASAIHDRSARTGRPFVTMNCGALTETLLESELFGHVKGSFTGAYRDKAGKLQMADRGTLFLDEIGETTLRMQGLLLRFADTGELQRVGSDAPPVHVDVRIIAATNRDLREMVLAGQFRQDLFYRLNVIHLPVPPLRERLSDVPQLVEFFLHRRRTDPSVVLRRFSDEAMHTLTTYPWPGNVRELENAIERLVVHCREEVATREHLPRDIRTGVEAMTRPPQERRRSVADDLYERMAKGRQSFWTAVYPLYMRREITRANVRDLVRMGLQETRGSYKLVAKMFNLQPQDYRRFLSFLRKHDCQLPFHEFRQ
jgi:transcriptional regulator with GAF, ATPase, and Fis domain